MFVFLLGGVALGADVAKIGVLDFQKILESSKAGKAAQAEINEEGKVMETELKRRGEEITELEQQIETEKMVMNEDVRQEKQRDIRIKINDLKTLQKKYLREFKVLEEGIIKRLQKDVFGIVREIGAEKGYLLILEKRAAGVVYSPETLDVTDDVIKAYDARYAVKGDAKSE
jgi:outer membrane protein